MCQLSEQSEDSHRVEKRRKALADLKGGEVYRLAVTSGAARPLTPDPEDRATSKRHWDTLVTLWKRDLRLAAESEGTLTVGVTLAPPMVPSSSLPPALLSARAPLASVQGVDDLQSPQAPAAPPSPELAPPQALWPARDLEALRGARPSRGAGRALGSTPLPGKRFSTPGVTERVMTHHRPAVCGAALGASLDLVKKQPEAKRRQPFLVSLARILLFFVVASAGLAADQLLFGDDHSPPQPVACQVLQASEAAAEPSLQVLEEASPASHANTVLSINGVP